MSKLREPLTHFDPFYRQLKVVEQVLTHPGRSERIVGRCMQGTLWAGHAQCILCFNVSLHESRWNVVAMFCKCIVKPLGVLRRCRNQRLYEYQGKHDLEERAWTQDSGRKFVPSELTEVLLDPQFRFYIHMIIKLKQVPLKLARWFNGCPCHEG